MNAATGRSPVLSYLLGKLLIQGGPLPGSISAHYYSDMRNVAYRVCGILIVVCIVLAVLADNLLGRAAVDELHPVFRLESVAIIAFGVSWLIKGETILRGR